MRAIDFLDGAPEEVETRKAHIGLDSPELAQAHSAPRRSVREALGIAAQSTRPIIEGAGGAVGSVVGAAGGPIGALAGGGLGYGIGKKIADIIEEQTGAKVPEPLVNQMLQSVADVLEGAAFEMAGQSAGPAIQKGAELAGKVTAPLLGRLSGVGTGAVREAYKGSDLFEKALRGKITGEEVVSNVKDALATLKDQRQSAYQAQLSKIDQTLKIDPKPITDKVAELMKKYGVGFKPDGTLDVSRVAMGKTGRNDIEDVIRTISDWGTNPKDTTAEGLDTLKRQLDDFYSDSGQARAFVTSLRNTVKDTIVKAVPEYGKMTKDYSEATKLIKDIESGLMTRKQGISGRIVADQTLRRLLSSMKDNFALRGELVDTLGAAAGQDLSGQIAGYAMRSPMPVGLAGTGPAIAGQAAFAMFNPKFWPVLAASSPRVQGEFLRYFGKVAQKAGKVSPEALKELTRQGLINADDDDLSFKLPQLNMME